jgi:hypothetical protein
MGLSYTNVFLYNVEQQAVLNFLKKQRRIAYVSYTQADFTVVYDKETENQNAGVIETFSELLTKELGCVGLTSLVHNSEFFVYWLYGSGKLLDLYNSLPYCPGGDPKTLCGAFDRISSIREVQKVFELVEQSHLDHGHFQLQFQGEDIHRAFVQALGIPSHGAFIGYDIIENTDLPTGLNRDTFVRTQD